jgi:hypothetical protein
MSDDRKIPLWPWIVALLVVLPMLYVGSVGPAFWLHRRMGIGGRTILVVYRPVLDAFAPESRYQELLSSYVLFGVERDIAPCEHDGDIVWLGEDGRCHR